MESVEAPAYDEALVKARLVTSLRWRKKGMFLASHLRGLAEVADVEDALRAAARAGVVGDLEVTVLVSRLIQGLGRRQTMALMVDPDTGRPPSEATVSRALKSGIRKVTAWLNGTEQPADESEESEGGEE